MPGHSTVVHQAIGPAPSVAKELVHIEAKPHRGGVKLQAHVMEGGKLSKHEHQLEGWGEAHEKMGEYMGHAKEEAPGEPESGKQEQVAQEREAEPQEEEEA